VDGVAEGKDEAEFFKKVRFGRREKKGAMDKRIETGRKEWKSEGAGLGRLRRSEADLGWRRCLRRNEISRGKAAANILTNRSD